MIVLFADKVVLAPLLKSSGIIRRTFSDLLIFILKGGLVELEVLQKQVLVAVLLSLKVLLDLLRQLNLHQLVLL